MKLTHPAAFRALRLLPREVALHAAARHPHRPRRIRRHLEMDNGPPPIRSTVSASSSSAARSIPVRSRRIWATTP